MNRRNSERIPYWLLARQKRGARDRWLCKTPGMKPPKRVVNLLVPAVVAAALGFALVFTTLKGTVEPVLGWSLAALLYALAIALTVTLVRLVIARHQREGVGPGIDPRSDR